MAARCGQHLLAVLLAVAAIAAVLPRGGEARALPSAAAAAAGGTAGGSFEQQQAGGGAPSTPPQRRLLQTSTNATDCASVPNCVACRFRFFSGTVTRATCLKCDAGYAVKASGRQCWCAPGFFQSAPNKCAPCGPGGWCPGAKSTASSAVRIPCGANKVTQSDFSASERDCVTLPGFGWAVGDAQVCPIGMYSPGGTSRPCTPCPGGLTTAKVGAASITDCVAPAGTYYLGGRAAPCAQGYFKDYIGNDDCDTCPIGFTTPPGSSGAASMAACSYIVAGFQAPPNANLTEDAEPCPAGSFRVGDAPYNATTGVSCTPCPDYMSTADDGATSPDACVTDAGAGWDRATGLAAPCPVGTYNRGLNREACAPCGTGAFTTDAPGAATPDECLVPAGYYAKHGPDGVTLDAQPCPVGTFGRPAPTYGRMAFDCSACPESTTTTGNASTSADQCITVAGFGWESSGSQQCDFGFYSSGGSQSPCRYCGDGYNTTSTPGGTVPAAGATSAAQCAIAAGWAPDGGAGLKPCPQGSYKSALGPSACLKCAGGTTTSLELAATAASDCDTCRPGFGTNTGIDPSSPSCAICPSGTYSLGGVVGGKACEACPQPVGWNGAMVSRLGAVTPDACVAQFTNGPQPWNLIPMSDAALTPTADATAAACQAACADSPACQYHAFLSFKAPGSQCYLRDKVPFRKVNVDDPSKDYVLFEVRTGLYVAYEAHPTDAASLGVPINAYATREAALSACSDFDGCAGVKFVRSEAGAGGAPWKTFRGALWEAAAGAVRAVGESLNPWIAGPSPDNF